jgi:lysophospholipase L1-like esterase
MRLRNVLIGLVVVAVAAAAAVEVARRGTSSSSPAPPRRAPVTLVGDSLNVGVEPYLQDELRGWRIGTDDMIGRSTATGIEHLRSMGAGLGRYVVISLGTNDPVDAVDAFETDAAEVLRLAGPSRCVVWATIHRDGDAYERFNAVLRDASAANGNLRLVEWASMVAEHPDWLAADGIHGSPAGYRARARAIVAAMRACPGSA